jgi:hypothetical protein
MEARSWYRRAEARTADLDPMLPRENRLLLVGDGIRKDERAR